MMDQEGYQYFRLEKITEGVYAGIANPDAGTIANVGIVDLGEEVLVVDSFMLPQAARELLFAVDQVVAKPVRYLVNTHAHDDHFIGNYLFPAETSILSTPVTREWIVEYAEDLPEAIAETAAYMADLEQQIQVAESTTDRQRLERSLTRFRRYLEASGDMEIRPPNLIFDARLVIHGSQRRVELLSYGVGHTASDAIVFLPDDRIVFPGDLVLVNTQPFLLYGDLESWRAALGQIERLDFDRLVPGHGPVGVKSGVALIRTYLEKIETLVQQVVDDGGTVDEALKLPIPPEFADWSGGAYRSNLRFLFERISAS